MVNEGKSEKDAEKETDIKILSHLHDVIRMAKADGERGA